MQRTPPLGPPSPANRKAFVIRYGILRCGTVLGVAAFVWIISGEYGATLEHLQTRAGWLRLLLLIALCVGEWVIAAGWVIGNVIWYLRQRHLP